MKFTNAAAVEQVCWEMRLADWPRAQNRVRINNLFNGAPPYSDDEQRQNRITTNVNDLSGSHIDMAARGQFSNALITPDPLINIELDYGPVWKKREWAGIITREFNKKLKNSLDFQEEEESVFAGVVLHGIGPANWVDRYAWCPDARGIEDVLIPSETLRSLRNLPMFAIYRSYTAAELSKLTTGPNVDPGWNLPLVQGAIQWVDEQARSLMGSRWPAVWSPEKMNERLKEDAGLYMSDAVPTIDTFDFYFWEDAGKKSGWRRRVILDAWGSPGVGGAGGNAMIANSPPSRSDRYGLGSESEFLYDSGQRIYAEKLEQIVHFQFGDASAVAPFRYHSVRSLGFLLYAVCHLQNRLKCKFHDHVFENLLQYFRVANPADAERLSQVDLVDKGIIPEGLSFVTQQERWQINDGVVEQALGMNRQTMTDNSASFSQDQDLQAHTDETATRTMAKVNASSALISSMLGRAYNYQKFKLMEIGRRFCLKNSRDGDVRSFRVECLKAGVPEDALNVERWNVQPVRVIGNGNKMMQVAMMDKIMGVAYPRLDPDAQKEMLRLYIAVNSGDYDLANRSVPETKHVSDSVHDAQLAAGTLLAGLPVSLKSGMNHQEYVETLLHSMATVVQEIEGQGGTATAKEITGLQNMAGNITQHIQLLAQDKDMEAQVRQYSDDLAKLMNLVKAYAQRLQQAQQDAAKQGAGADPADAAKLQAQQQSAAQKLQNDQQTAAQKHAQKALEFEQTIKQNELKHRQELEHQQQTQALELATARREHAANLAKLDLEGAHAIKLSAEKAKAEPEGESEQ